MRAHAGDPGVGIRVSENRVMDAVSPNDGRVRSRDLNPSGSIVDRAGFIAVKTLTERIAKQGDEEHTGAGYQLRTAEPAKVKPSNPAPAR